MCHIVEVLSLVLFSFIMYIHDKYIYSWDIAFVQVEFLFRFSLLTVQKIIFLWGRNGIYLSSPCLWLFWLLFQLLREFVWCQFNRIRPWSWSSLTKFLKSLFNFLLRYKHTLPICKACYTGYIKIWRATMHFEMSALPYEPRCIFFKWIKSVFISPIYSLIIYF